VELLNKSIKILEKVNAVNLKLFDFKGKSPFFDYFLIGTLTDRKSQAALSYFNSEFKNEIKNIEGRNNLGWVLIDLGDLIIHLFGEEEREFYNFDEKFMEYQKDLP